MQAIQVIKGASAPANSKKYTISEEGLAMASVPEWRLLIDPSYTKVEDRTVLNRAQYNSSLSSFDTAGTTATIPLDSFTTGAPAFATTDSSIMRLSADTAFPVDNWSVIFVAKPSVKTDSNLNIVLTGNTYTSDTSLISPKIGFNMSTTVLYIAGGGAVQQDGNRPYRLTYNHGSALSAETAVYIVTGSSKNGLSIYRNGIKVASSTSESAKKPINHQFAAGDWHVLRGSRGLFGYVGVLGIDLNDESNSENLNKINSFLMKKYGIA